MDKAAKTLQAAERVRDVVTTERQLQAKIARTAAKVDAGHKNLTRLRDNDQARLERLRHGEAA